MIKQGFLSKKGGKWRPVRLLDIAILLLNAYKANEQPEIGYQDTIETLDALSRRLNQKILLDPRQIESLLWACNMLDEEGKFVHPTGMKFDDFVHRVAPGGDFSKKYNTVEWKDGGGNYGE